MPRCMCGPFFGKMHEPCEMHSTVQAEEKLVRSMYVKEFRVPFQIVHHGPWAWMHAGEYECTCGAWRQAWSMHQLMFQGIVWFAV